MIAAGAGIVYGRTMSTARTPGIEALVERQATRWSVSRRLGTAQAADVPAACVAFSRLAHSHGDEVADRVAAALDYGLFGSGILRDIARERDTPEWLLAGLDERMRGLIDRYVGDVFRHGGGGDELFRQVVRTMSTIGRRGRSVLVGRGAPFVLAPRHTLRVLVTAPHEVRVQRCAASRGVAPDEARRQLDADDRQRTEFLAFHFRVRHDDPCLYDLVVNTEHLGVADAARLVVEAFRARFPDAAAGPAGHPA